MGVAGGVAGAAGASLPAEPRPSLRLPEGAAASAGGAPPASLGAAELTCRASCAAPGAGPTALLLQSAA